MSEQEFVDGIQEEYGYQKSLHEILLELSTYCSMNGLDQKKNKITIILPNEILSMYNKITYAKERIILNNMTTQQYPITNPTLYATGGTISLFSSDDYSTTKKRKKK